MHRDARRRLLTALGVLAAVVVPAAVSAELIERIEYRHETAGAPATSASVRLQPVTLAAGGAPPRSLPSGALHGSAAWDIRWSAPLQRRPDGRCAVMQPATVLTFVITLPETSAADARARPRLQGQIDALGLHEAGHLVIAQATARQVDAGLIAIELAPDCAALARTAERLAHVAIEQGRRDQAAYDVWSDHVRTVDAALSAPR